MENPVIELTYDQMNSMSKDDFAKLYKDGIYKRIKIKTLELTKDPQVFHDGDTLYPGGVGNRRPGIRLLGIDAPELDQVNKKTGEKVGVLAQQKLKEKILDSEYTYIDFEGFDPTYNRVVAKVSTDKIPDVGLDMLKDGYVFFNEGFVKNIPPKDVEGYMDAAILAENAKIVYNPDVDTPSVYRAAQNKAEEYVVETKDTTKTKTELEAQKQVEEKELKDLTKALEDEKVRRSQTKKSLAYLSRLYDHFYSSSDVKVFFVGPTGKQVNVDLIVGVGYNYAVSTTPVYTLGSRFPAFFTRGNAIGQGSLVFPFKNDKYLRVMLKYIFEELTVKNPYTIEIPDDLSTLSDEQFKKLSENYSTNLAATLSADEAIDIGAVGTTFDIQITLNNTNAFSTDDGTKIIILKDCKISGEELDTSSARDGTIQHGYKFLFKTIATGTK